MLLSFWANSDACSLNLSKSVLQELKNNKAKAMRFSTLEAICKALDCQPGDILEYALEEINTTLDTK